MLEKLLMTELLATLEAIELEAPPPPPRMLETIGTTTTPPPPLDDATDDGAESDEIPTALALATDDDGAGEDTTEDALGLLAEAGDDETTELAEF